jgi:hypothetical protein
MGWAISFAQVSMNLGEENFLHGGGSSFVQTNVEDEFLHTFKFTGHITSKALPRILNGSATTSKVIVINTLNRPGFVGDFILGKRGWSHGQTRQAWPEVFGGRKSCSGSDGEDVAR